MDLIYGKKTLIMGILNITPDSFYDGGRNFKKDDAVKRAMELYNEGADIIDIGGESTRPGARAVEVSEEIDRVCPVIEALLNEIEIPISIDTYKAKVAEEALKIGARIINDISGLNFDKKMAETAAKYGSYIVITHIKGAPQNMQNNPHYDDLLNEIIDYLQRSKEKATDAGIDIEKIIIDPGIGFGKTLEDNYTIIKRLDIFKQLNLPILIGLSRKSLIGKLYEKNYERLYATIALNSIAALKGADIIRVHDVEAHRLAMISVDMLKK